MMKNTSTTMPNDAAADKIDVVRLPLRLAAARLYRMLLLLLPLTLLLSSCFTGNTALRVVAMMDAVSCAMRVRRRWRLKGLVIKVTAR